LRTETGFTVVDTTTGSARNLPGNQVNIARRIRTETKLGREYADLFPKAESKPKGEALDETILATWVRVNRVKPYEEGKARRAYSTFRHLTGKAFATATREDGRALAEHLLLTMAWQSVDNCVGYLRAACNIAMDDKALSANPFSRVMPEKQKGYAVKRLGLDVDDMATLRAHLHELGREDQLLWVLLAQTGMRLSEPFQAREEHRESGICYIEIGTKTESSERKVPLPDAALPYLPAKIKGPIFSDTPKNAGRRLMRWMRSHGITSLDEKGRERKVVHSLRHRAKTRLRELQMEGCPSDVKDALMGLILPL
jgi:integrase